MTSGDTPPRANPPTVRETLLADYLRRALTLIEAGEEVDPDELCRDQPELASALADALRVQSSMQALHASGADDPLVGLALADRYRLEGRLGMGASGVVYRATDLELKREVAVKVLARSFPDSIETRRFTREAEVLAALHHRHVVMIHDRGLGPNGQPFLVMEYLRGASLAELLAEREEAGSAPDSPFAPTSAAFAPAAPAESSWLRQVLLWAADLASGLTGAHAHGVFHRDVKPSNIFIAENYRAVLLDFGIAARQADGDLTGTSLLGTPWYMAPEQVAGQPPGPETDVWGLCATLYHLVTGQPPFTGAPHEVLDRIARTDPVPAVRHVPKLPRDVQAILDRGLERAPKRRYPSMAALEADLRAFLDHQPVSVRPLGNAARAWRRVRLAPAKYLAYAATSVAAVLAVTVIPLLSTLSAQERQERVEEIHSELPALLAVEGYPKLRLFASLEPERAEIIARLDELLALAPGDLPARMWRASLHLDSGDQAAAAADLAELRASSDSPYFRELANRFAAADQTLRGTEAVSLEGLPEPHTDVELYAHGFLELRNRQIAGFAERAESCLSRAMETYPPARDLRLIALLARGPAWYREAHDEALLLEGHYGHPTARTRAVIGAALTGLQRFEDAIEPLRDSLRLRPARHGPAHNLGNALYKLGRIDEAEKHLLEAMRLRPHFANTKIALTQLYRDRGDFAAAAAMADSIEVPESDPFGWGWQKAYTAADVRRRHAIALHVADAAEFGPTARTAVEFLEAAAQHPDMPAAFRSRCALYVDHLRSVARSDSTRAIDAFLQALLDDRSGRSDPHMIEQLWTLLPPGGASPELMADLRTYLLRLAGDLAGSDEPLKQRLQQHEAKTREELHRIRSQPEERDGGER